MKVENEINKSFKWSTITEISVKLISPILNAILARILLPEDFAPLTTITMIISFGEVFVESGFKKYLIQHEFKNHEEYKSSFNVAFWSNFVISIFIWGIIAIFSKQISSFLGSPEIWQAVAISGSILPMFGISGIFSVILQKDLKFKKLFVVRIVTAFIPLFITIPLALLGLEYWSLVIGNIASVFAQMIVLIIISNHRIDFYYSFNILKQMYSYGFWTMFDGIAIWLTNWIDSLIIAKFMSDYYLGMYKNSLATINSLFAIVTSAVVPVLFVGLSKYQNDDNAFSDFFNSTQRRLAMLLIPIGTGVLLYRDFAVSILFGDKWSEAAGIIGVVALTTALRTVFVSICSDAYRAKGKFRIPLILQIIDICLIVPVCILFAQKGFWYLVYARALIKLDLIIPEMIIMKKAVNINSLDNLKKMTPVFLGVSIMSGACLFFQTISDSIIWNIFSIVIAIFIYVLFLMIFPSYRKELYAFFKS